MVYNETYTISSEVNAMSAEKAIASAVDTMINDLTAVLKKQGIETQDGQIFDLSEHGIYNEQRKVRHSDSQKVLTDPQALSAYQLRASKALWNFAVTLKKIIITDSLGGKAKLGYSESSFMADNIHYLDSTYLNESGNIIPGRTASNASIIVNSTTLALAKIYHEFLVTIAANKQGLLGMVPSFVRMIIGSLLDTAVSAAAEISQTLQFRESQFEKKLGTLIHPAKTALYTYQPFFQLAEQIEGDLAEIEKNEKARPEQVLEFLQVHQKKLLAATIDKDSILAEAEKLTISLKEIQSKPLSEIEIDIKVITQHYEDTLRTLADYHSKFEETINQQLSLLEKLKQKTELVTAQMNEGKRNTPMEQRPTALRATLAALQKKIITHEENQRLDQELEDIQTLLPLKCFVDEISLIKFPYSQDKFNALVKLLNLSKNDQKRLGIICDKVVILEDSKKQRGNALQELLVLATKRLGVNTYKTSEYISNLMKVRGQEPASQEIGQRLSTEIDGLSKQLNETLKTESRDYQRKLAPLLSSTEEKLDFLKEKIGQNNAQENNALLAEAQKSVSAINQLNSDYDDCELNKSGTQHQKQIEHVKSTLDEIRKTITANSQLNERKKLFTAYFGKEGKVTKYLDEREEKYRWFDNVQNKLGFFRKPGVATDAQDRSLFLGIIMNHLINYVDSGDTSQLNSAIKKIDAAVKNQRFPSRRFGMGELHTMNALLVNLNVNLLRERQNHRSEKESLFEEQITIFQKKA
jgi:hypothetical protein